jgi:L-iditol 2-dehydrogenase
MRALRKMSPGFGLQLMDVPEPPDPAPNQVQIQIRATGICGSDLHVYEWTPGYEFMIDRLPVTIGHEFAGKVTQVGSHVCDYEVGGRVTAWPTTACGTCFHCAQSRPQDCQAREVVGLHINGGFASHVNVPAWNCFHLPGDLELELAALCEPLTIAENALDIGDCGEGDTLVVLGPGPIGLGLAWLAQRRGCEPVMLVGMGDDARLDLARRMGIAYCVDLRDEDLEAAVLRVFGRKVDRVIEASGATRSITDGLSILRSSGILVVVGIHSAPVEIAVTPFVRDKKQIRAAHDTRYGAWPRVIEVLRNHQDVLGQMVTQTLPLDKAIEGFEVARRKDAMKILIHPEAV